MIVRLPRGKVLVAVWPNPFSCMRLLPWQLLCIHQVLDSRSAAATLAYSFIVTSRQYSTRLQLKHGASMTGQQTPCRTRMSCKRWVLECVLFKNENGVARAYVLVHVRQQVTNTNTGGTRWPGLAWMNRMSVGTAAKLHPLALPCGFMHKYEAITVTARLSQLFIR